MSSEVKNKLLHNAQRLKDKKLFHSPQDLISVLLPGESAMLYMTPGQPPERYEFSDSVEGVPLAVASRLTLHAEIYQLRQDVGAIAHLSPRWSCALSKLPEIMPSVFDEHARHIGRSWRLQASPSVAAAIAKAGNCGTVNEQLLAMGVTQNRMVFNAELFEKCAMAYTLARISGKSVSRVPWWVRLIAGSRLKSDKKKATASHQAGQAAEELKAY